MAFLTLPLPPRQRVGAAVAAVQAEAHKVLGPLLARQSQGDSVRSVLALLRRQRGLFLLPSRLRAAAARGDAPGAIREWRAARALIGPDEPPVLHALLAEAEREVGRLQEGLAWLLAAPGASLEAAEAAARLLLEMQAVREGGSGVAHASSSAAPSPEAARPLVAAFVAGRGARLAAELEAAWGALEAALAAREEKRRRRLRSGGEGEAGAADTLPDGAAAAEGAEAADGADAPPAAQAVPRPRHRRTGSVELDKALLSAPATAPAAARAAAARAYAEAAAEMRLRFVRAAAAAALRALPDMWRFAAALLPAAPHAAQLTPPPPARGAAGGLRRTASGLAADAAVAGDPGLEKALRKGAEGACGRIRDALVALADGGAQEGHLRAALAEVGALCAALADAGAPPAAARPVEALRAWGLQRLVSELCARMAADADAAAALHDSAPAPPADVAATAALLAHGGGGGAVSGDDAAGADDAFAAARGLRVSARPLALASALLRGMTLLSGAAAEGGAAAAADAAAAARDCFFGAFERFADALATHAEAARVVNRDGSAPEGTTGEGSPAKGQGAEHDWEGTAMALLADSALARLWVLPALRERFAAVWAAATGGAAAADVASAAVEDALGALEEHVLGGYIGRHDASLRAAASAFFDGDGTDWARAPPPRAARDACLALLDALAASHAAAHARAGPFADGVLGALAAALLRALAEAAAAQAAPGGRLRLGGLNPDGYAQLSLELELLRDALGAYWSDAAEADATAAAAAVAEAACASAKAAAAAVAAASGSRAGFSRTAARAALGAHAADATARLLPREQARTALHTLCFRPDGAPPPLPQPPPQPPSPPPPRERVRERSREAAPRPPPTPQLTHAAAAAAEEEEEEAAEAEARRLAAKAAKRAAKKAAKAAAAAGDF
jgi:hypothetical protein